MVTATACTPAVGPNENLGRDVLGVDRANASRDIPHDPSAMTVVQLSERSGRLDRPPDQLNVASCWAHILYVGIRIQKVRTSDESHADPVLAKPGSEARLSGAQHH
jgi:hypothetical protein